MADRRRAVVIYDPYASRTGIAARRRDRHAFPSSSGTQLGESLRWTVPRGPWQQAPPAHECCSFIPGILQIYIVHGARIDYASVAGSRAGRCRWCPEGDPLDCGPSRASPWLWRSSWHGSSPPSWSASARASGSSTSRTLAARTLDQHPAAAGSESVRASPRHGSRPRSTAVHLPLAWPYHSSASRSWSRGPPHWGCTWRLRTRSLSRGPGRFREGRGVARAVDARMRELRGPDGERPPSRFRSPAPGRPPPRRRSRGHRRSCGAGPLRYLSRWQWVRPRRTRPNE